MTEGAAEPVWSGLIGLVPISRDVRYGRVDLRHAHRTARGKKLELPDALHPATAIQRPCRYFVSGAEGIRPPGDMGKLSPLTDDFDAIVRAL